MEGTVKMVKKHIILDARIIDEHLNGISRYTYELIKGISKNDNVQYSLLINDISKAKIIFKDIPNLKYIKVKSKFLSLGEIIELPLVLNKYKDKAIFHSPSFSISPFISTNMIMTIHDLNHLEFPQFYTPFHKYYYEFIVKPSAIKCSKILTVSNFSKKKIVEWLKCDPDKVQVTYNGINSTFTPIDDSNMFQAVRKKYSLPEKFVLYIGNLKEHKNVVTLIKSMKYVKKIKLILNGKETQELKDLIEKLDIWDRVSFIGYVDDEDIKYLYNMAEIFVFPSLYEGFGLPPLEAMACGCPTIISDAECLRELITDDDFTFEKKDYKQLAEKINELLEDEKLRKKFIDKGVQFASNYTWSNCINKTLEIYNDC